MVSLEGLFRLLGSAGADSRGGSGTASTPTSILVSFLLVEGCGQGERNVVGRVRFVRSVPYSGSGLPRYHHHGVMTVSLLNAFGLQRGRGRISIALDVTSGTGPPTSCRISGTVREVLEELAARGFHDIIARIEGCDWMLTRGRTPGTIDVLREDRRLAVLRV